MVTGGGLRGSSDIWVSGVYYDPDLLMKSWRKAVIALLRAALRAGQLRTELTVDQMEDLLTHFEKCWWSVKVQLFENKWHFLQYAGRYVRRPPIAQRRITCIAERSVTFWTKDKSCVAALRCNTHWKSSSTFGPSTFRNAISTLFGALGCLLRARSGKPRQPSLPFWGRSEGHAPNLALGRIP
jgi:hypothetical protein